jgi:thiamine biosynthesis lipoprotein
MIPLRPNGPVWAGTLAALVVAAPAAAEVRSWQFYAEHMLGTSLDIIAVARDEVTAAVATRAARAEIMRLDAVLSGWRNDSELAALNGAPAKQVSSALFDVITAGERWRQATGGAFDGRLGEVLRLWRQASASGVPAIEDNRLRTAMIRAAGHVELDAVRRIVSRPAGVRFEPRRVSRRPFGLGQAAKASTSA